MRIIFFGTKKNLLSRVFSRDSHVFLREFTQVKDVKIYQKLKKIVLLGRWKVTAKKWGLHLFGTKIKNLEILSRVVKRDNKNWGFWTIGSCFYLGSEPWAHDSRLFIRAMTVLQWPLQFQKCENAVAAIFSASSDCTTKVQNWC